MELKITKYDPSVDAKPYVITVSVDWYKNMTLLEAIQFAHEKNPISFDYNCRGRQCGRCAVMLDGVQCMACCTFIKDEAHTIEPLKGFPVLRDLIVDKKADHDAMTARYRRMKTISVDLNKLSDINDNFSKDSALGTAYMLDPDPAKDVNTRINRIESLEWCARCMACTSGCPAYNADPSSYVGPAEMLAIAYRFYDPYDAGNRIREAVDAGLWNCIMCGNCDTVCVQSKSTVGAMKKVKQIWKDLRDAATAAGYPNPYA